MSTPVTTPADLIQHYDVRDIRELVVDDNSDVAGLDVTTDAIVLKHIAAAEGKVTAYLAKAGRYTADEIASLTGCDLEFYKQLVSQFAMLSLLTRRPRFDSGMLAAHEALIKGIVKDLQDGDILLGQADEDIEAGRASVDGPTLSELQRNNWWVTRADYFPQRVLPRGRNR